jgi:hypothetical protein
MTVLATILVSLTVALITAFDPRTPTTAPCLYPRGGALLFALDRLVRGVVGYRRFTYLISPNGGNRCHPQPAPPLSDGDVSPPLMSTRPPGPDDGLGLQLGLAS